MQPLQEMGLRHAETYVHQDRFKNDGGDFAGIFFEATFDGYQIVEGGNHHVGDAGFRHTEASGNGSRSVNVAEIRSMRLDADQGTIVETVISSFKLDNFFASRGGAGQANSMHGSFCTAGTKAYHLHRKTLADFFRELPFHVMGHAKHGASAEPLLDRFHHGRMAMPGHQCTKT